MKRTPLKPSQCFRDHRHPIICINNGTRIDIPSSGWMLEQGLTSNHLDPHWMRTGIPSARWMLKRGLTSQQLDKRWYQDS